MKTTHALIVSLAISLLVGSAAAWYAGYSRMVVLVWLVLLFGYLIATGLAVPIALYEANPYQGTAIVSLDPRDQSVDFRVDLVDPAETDLELMWGELHELSGTARPAKMALRADVEDETAIGTWWKSLPPNKTLGYIHKLDEVYTMLEREAAKATKAESTIRTQARRRAAALQSEHMSDLDDVMIPGSEAHEVDIRADEQEPDAHLDDYELEDVEVDRGSNGDRPDRHDHADPPTPPGGQ